MLEIKVTIGLEPKAEELLRAFIALKSGADNVGAEKPNAPINKATPVEPQKPPKKAQPAKVEEMPTKTGDDAPSAEIKPQEDAKPVALDIEDVRAVLAEAKHTYGLEKVKPILKKYGKGDLASVPAEKYAELVAELKATLPLEG